MPSELLSLVESTTLTPEVIARRARAIREAILEESPHLDAGNFTRIHPDDLEALFDCYDVAFFDGRIREMLDGAPMRFGLSKRMTSSGGTTTHHWPRDPHRQWFEIRISTALLFTCFKDEDHRPIDISGIVCRDRTDALQRIMEHELVHLVERLLWNQSSCARPRFHSITRRFFGHTENKHRLITPKERARVKHGVQPGTRVRFDFEGVEFRGIVNRINKRATVLVEDRQGTRYTDGKRYKKYYVPIGMLEREG